MLVLLIILLAVLGVYYERHNVASVTLTELNTARRGEGVAAFVPPPHFANSTSSEQLALLLNSERVARGLPAGLLSTDDEGFVQTALDTNADPLPITKVRGVELVGTIWGWGSLDSTPYSNNQVAALEYLDYSWVYHDGYDGLDTTNADCTSAHAPGCNGHRRDILTPNPPGTTLVIIALATGHVLNRGRYGTAAAAELIWTTRPAAFHASRLPRAFDQG